MLRKKSRLNPGVFATVHLRVFYLTLKIKTAVYIGV
jgi:hypothetical protein